MQALLNNGSVQNMGVCALCNCNYVYKIYNRQLPAQIRFACEKKNCLDFKLNIDLNSINNIEDSRLNVEYLMNQLMILCHDHQNSQDGGTDSKCTNSSNLSVDI